MISFYSKEAETNRIPISQNAAPLGQAEIGVHLGVAITSLLARVSRSTDEELAIGEITGMAFWRYGSPFRNREISF